MLNKGLEIWSKSANLALLQESWVYLMQRCLMRELFAPSADILRLTVAIIKQNKRIDACARPDFEMLTQNSRELKSV